MSVTGTGDEKGGMSREVARLVEALVSASVGGSTHKVYAGKWKTWVDFMEQKGKGPWLHVTDESEVINLLLEFMACRLFVFNNQQSTVRGYLSAIKFFHKLFLGWDLPTDHCSIAAAARGIDRIRGSSGKKKQVRLPLTWAILAQGYFTVTAIKDGGPVIWLGLALSYFLLCRASELFAYENGLVHPEFCLTRNCLTFFCGDIQVDFEGRAAADSVKILFVASKSDQSRTGHTITRQRGGDGAGNKKTPVGAFEAIIELLKVHPNLPKNAPLMTRITAGGRKVVTRPEAVAALRMMVACTGRDPTQFALHSGRIGGATQLAAQGMSELQIQRAGRWKSRAFMSYVREAGEGAKAVSAALARK